jgi:hypothetical protein
MPGEYTPHLMVKGSPVGTVKYAATKRQHDELKAKGYDHPDTSNAHYMFRGTGSAPILVPNEMHREWLAKKYTNQVTLDTGETVTDAMEFYTLPRLQRFGGFGMIISAGHWSSSDCSDEESIGPLRVAALNPTISRATERSVGSTSGVV